MKIESTLLEINVQAAGEIDTPATKNCSVGTSQQNETPKEPSLSKATFAQGASNSLPTLHVAGSADTPHLRSLGSALHGTGACRPCAWYWKQGGCQNGKDCYHCHLCPEGEIKARRKMKSAWLRQDTTGFERQNADRSMADASRATHPTDTAYQLAFSYDPVVGLF